MNDRFRRLCRFTQKRTQEDIDAQLYFGVMLIVFKNLNYFPELKITPNEIVHWVKLQLKISSAQFYITNPMTFSRNKKRIYKHFGITPWNDRHKTSDDKKIYPVKYINSHFTQFSAC